MLTVTLWWLPWGETDWGWLGPRGLSWSRWVMMGLRMGSSAGVNRPKIELSAFAERHMLRPLSWVLGAHPLGAFPASVSTSNKCGEAALAETLCVCRGERTAIFPALVSQSTSIHGSQLRAGLAPHSSQLCSAGSLPGDEGRVGPALPALHVRLLPSLRLFLKLNFLEHRVAHSKDNWSRLRLQGALHLGWSLSFPAWHCRWECLPPPAAL